jgi:hypothetical protein
MCSWVQITKKEPNQGNSHRQCCDNRKHAAKQLKFTGRCKALHGHIFDCSDAQQANMFTKSLKEVAEYGGCMCKSSALIFADPLRIWWGW